ncbi:hypothetical protein E3P96_00477 [Wallemia ichthyophaga]|nr:hypothetical protein E3P96_00477 [Wallemia ichthyophaga]TIB32410.1 hypothetical protein E3P85_01891 [Wallemia ichthyophaga]TIB50237.1 hypothetical protein E3P82_00564 [Wallemia ichthyophaga]TIB56445.1 hypothetical protein E3P80_00565 [Wallemia ichthyophaga]TIB61526.1 hypothetical protein E3P79_00565 [Wallemia ichthyophaga]
MTAMTIDEDKGKRWSIIAIVRKRKFFCCSVTDSVDLFLSRVERMLTQFSFGSLIEPLEEWYGYSERVISLAFLFFVAGSITSSYLSSICIQKIGVQYFIMSMTVLYCTGALIDAFRPPVFPAYVFGVYLLGVGTGSMQTSATVVLSHFEDGPLMSLIYANMALGSVLSPFVIGAFLQHDIDWRHNFWIIVGFSVLLIFFSWFVFRDFETHDTSKDDYTFREKLAVLLPSGKLWSGLLAETGLLVCMDSTTQWLAPYLNAHKGLSNGLPQYVLTSLWGGILLGRLSLAHVSAKIGKRRSSFGMYIIICALMAGLWKVEGIAGIVVLTLLIGFFFGPLMPNTLSSATECWPRELRNAATSIVMATSLFGSLLGPFCLSQAADATTLAIYPPVIIVECFITAIIVSFTYITKPKKTLEKGDLEESPRSLTSTEIGTEFNPSPKLKTSAAI